MGVTSTGSHADAAPWLFFMFQLPAQGASQRVSVWRKLQKYGALPWKNAAYILPNTPSNLEKFQWLAAQVRKYRGEGSVVEVSRIQGYTRKDIAGLFSHARGRDFAKLAQDIRSALTARGRPTFARLNRRFREILALDAFGCREKKEVEALLKELEPRKHSDGDAGAAHTPKFSEFRARLWMTRPRPEMDRVASAWLIKRFIDARARFVFSLDPHSHPRAVRFDMFEGEFTHVGEDCTFETLLKRFRLHDRRLRPIAELVHDADLEDNKFGRPEGKAVEQVIKGWGKMGLADEEILRRGSGLFDALYQMAGA